MGDLALAQLGNKRAFEGWAVTHSPAANVQASAAKSAAGANQKHHATAVTASFGAGATAGAAIQVNLRDGATGAGPVLWSCLMAAPANTAQTVTISDVDVAGSANTAMTLEFAAAGGLTTVQSVTLTGYTSTW